MMLSELDFETSNFILNQMSAGIALFDAQTLEMIWCNGSFRKQTWFGTASRGRKATRVVISDLFLEDDCEAIHQLIKIATEQGYSYDSERRMRRGRHRTFPAELKFYGVNDANSGGDFFCFEFMDLSITKLYEELQTREAELRKTQSDLVQASKMASLGEMAGGVAHEINNPLAIIRGRSELMEKFLNREPINVEVVRGMVRNIIETTDRIATIIRGLKNFAYGGGETGFQDYPVETIIRDTLALCQERFKSKAVKLIVPEEFGDVCIECQPIQISQVLLNLLNNAFDAVKNCEEKWVKIELHDYKEKVMIRLLDSGPGIPTYLQNKIMDPFFTTKEIGMGTGLGLSISKGIVNAHNGQLDLDSRSENTCFIVTLLKRQPTREETERAS